MLENYFAKKEPSIEALVRWIADLGGKTPAIRRLPARAAEYGSFGGLDPRIVEALKKRGVEALYTHQSRAVEYALAGVDCVIATPTASGKTLCYNLPVMHAILQNPAARALYLFPTKALAQDQLAELGELAAFADGEIRGFVYDGDTEPAKRRQARSEGHVVITNPDMLNSGILPHHTKWSDYFQNLKYIVIDELHTYRGIFGSHLANLFSRLARICDFYGSRPVFICSSATIANPLEHARELIGRDVELITESGAPASEKELIIYNPPVVDWKSGIRRSSLFESSRIASEALASGISTIVFTRSRLNVELLLKSIRGDLARRSADPMMIMGYRGGYLPKERRKIERDLRSGALRGVVSTNALELGIDIGSLGLAVLHGYPGSIASAWQQIGRAGRRGSLSAAVMVASADPLDQFLAQRPEWFYGAPTEKARIDPYNPYIQVSHVKCSAFELPFHSGELFGGRAVDEILDYLAEHEVLHKVSEAGDERYYWQSDSYPAAGLSLRSATGENYTITDVTIPTKPAVIGTMDRRSAPTLIFPDAIYFHGGKSYIVESLDTEKMQCFIREISADYYTDGDASLRINITDSFDTQGNYGWGEVVVTLTPTIFKKIKLATHENAGFGQINLPEEQMHSTACWLMMPQSRQEDAELKPAMEGLEQLLRNTAPLFLMCDRGDILVTSRLKDPQLRRAAIYIIDNIPGGVGLAEGTFEIKNELVKTALSALNSCGCRRGCPGCVGTLGGDYDLKAAVKKLAEEILTEK
ncbi:MAG: DEAD/DEAH box helicase [Synergistaceae bacterium]|nr:DEAD/DEAH box helicase [Synergistaceae bacterium]